MNNAIFLDRDGVIIEDVHLLTSESDIHILPGVYDALRMFTLMQYKLIIVSNQPVIARGLLDNRGVRRLQSIMVHLIAKETGILFDGFYYCPHHPKATIEKYRKNCTCRKPEPGLLLKAADRQSIDLKKSYMIGDRISDCIAGARAGCTTIQLLTGKHTEKPIESATPMDPNFKPDYTFENLFEAAKWIGMYG